MSERRRAILETILVSEDATVEQILRADERLAVLDGRDPDATSREFFADLEKLDDGDREGFMAPFLFPTSDEFIERRVTQVLSNESEFREAVERRARELQEDAAASVAELDRLRIECPQVESALRQERQRTADAAQEIADLGERLAAAECRTREAEEVCRREAVGFQRLLAEARDEMEELADLPQQLKNEREVREWQEVEVARLRAHAGDASDRVAQLELLVAKLEIALSDERDGHERRRNIVKGHLGG